MWQHWSVLTCCGNYILSFVLFLCVVVLVCYRATFTCLVVWWHRGDDETWGPETWGMPRFRGSSPAAYSVPEWEWGWNTTHLRFQTDSGFQFLTSELKHRENEGLPRFRWAHVYSWPGSEVDAGVQLHLPPVKPTIYHFVYIEEAEAAASKLKSKPNLQPLF